MRYEENIYILNDNRAVRNKDILNINMSSDFCIFKSPTFNLSGGTKIQCDSITCSFSGVSLSDIFTATTTTCYNPTIITEAFSVLTTWETKIYEDDILTYSNLFYDSISDFSGVTIPSLSAFSEDIKYGFGTLGYQYTDIDNIITINKPYGRPKTLNVDICLSFSGLSPEYMCPIGYSATPANDACQQVITSSAIYSGSGTTITIGDNDSSYCNAAPYTLFYPNLNSITDLPVYYDGYTLKNQIGETITPEFTRPTSTFWGNPLGNSTDGRLNVAGLSASTEWVGFSKCLDIISGGTYYIGISADNYCKFSLNGQLVVALTGTTLGSPNNANFGYWNIFPVILNSGKNIIEMYGKNAGSTTAFAAEIYYPITFKALFTATNTGATQANVIFSTLDYVGSTWELGQTFGYSCPSGYGLDTCSLPYTCVKINYTGITPTTCTDNCTILCNKTFPSIDNSSDGVHIITTATTIPLTFNFTGNTTSFTGNNLSFRYEIYKYDNINSLFTVPAVYTSESYDYVSFSGTNTLSTSIPISGLSLDGDYLVKGYYLGDSCTEFMRRLGKKIDTSDYKLGQLGNLYNSDLDYYFIGMTNAQTPLFTQSQFNADSFNGGFSLYQQVILVNDDSFLFSRTGATFTLSSNYTGNIAVTLNGLTLSKDLDYSLSGNMLTFFGSIINGDVITIIYTRTDTSSLISENISIDTVVPSGTTDTQGTNKFFYNTTTGKYEIYTVNQPIKGSDVIVVLNGITLANGVDYYQSTTNINRIILAGTIMVNDIIAIIYFPNASIINGIRQTNNSINWYIPVAPQSSNGVFELQYSQYSDFSIVNVSDSVDYQKNKTNYTGILSLTGEIGDVYYYRVKNTKNYESICGDIIEDTALSEVVKVIVQTNTLNTY